MNEQALELYRKACGLSAPLALEYEDPSRSTETLANCSFPLPFVLVGRDPRSDLVLDHAKVSRRHAFIHVIAGRLFVIDLQSRTKVYWGGEEAPTSRGWLDSDQFITVGPYRIRRTVSDASGNQDGALPALMAPLGQERPEAGPLPRAALELPIRTGDVPSLWSVEGQFAMVGSSDECELVLTDDSVSRFHAALVPTHAGLWVVDLFAREGVFVNAERVRWAWLADGDTLRIGRFAFVLRYEIAPNQITRQDAPLEAGASLAERPGTELAVRTGNSGNGRNTLISRRNDQSRIALNAASSPATFEPDTLVRSDREGWEPPMPFPLNPMAMWQQQMQLMESFHNDMILMVQMFVAMHREHLASVRHELDMVQELTGELSNLQAKLAKPSDSADVAATGGTGRRTQEHRPVQDPDHEKRDRKSASREATKASKRPDRTSTRPAVGPGSPSPKVRSAKGPVTPASPSPGNVDESQVHSLLTKRIAELQRERQGYWQRILSALHK
jgi:pSer/pThr/pTyr-binding forkhead associated (FHA) protein